MSTLIKDIIKAMQGFTTCCQTLRDESQPSKLPTKNRLKSLKRNINKDIYDFICGKGFTEK